MFLIKRGAVKVALIRAARSTLTFDSFAMNSDYVFIFLGLFVAFVALLKREWLIEQPSFGIILVISVVLFVIGVALHFTRWAFSSSGALLMPLMSLGLYRLLRWLFVSRYKHEPRDTWFVWTRGLAADRFFNIVFFMGCWLLGVFTAGAMEQLAKNGW